MMLSLTMSCLFLPLSVCLHLLPSLCQCVSWSGVVFLHLLVSLPLSPLCLPVCLGNPVKHSCLIRSLSICPFLPQVHVNPKYIVLESDFTNNVVRCNIHYTGRYVSTTNCKIVQ